jgi:hypothetical protein
VDVHEPRADPGPVALDDLVTLEPVTDLDDPAVGNGNVGFLCTTGPQNKAASQNE